ncbi:MAG: VOC family protein [Hyphomonadaceae bacterium]
MNPRIAAAVSACLCLAMACNGPASVPNAAGPDEAAAETSAAPVRKDPLLSAVGIGVSDLQRSRDFYVDVMGMQEIAAYNLDYMNEIVVGYPQAESYIVLMHWIDGTHGDYQDLPIKIVTRTRDPAALAAKIKAAGFEVTREPRPSAAVGGALVGFAKDPDGYVLELLPLKQPAP